MGTLRLVVDSPAHPCPVEAPLDRLSHLVTDTPHRLWLDIGDPGPDEATLLQRTFGFHEVALEDVTRAHERPRCDAHSDYRVLRSGDVPADHGGRGLIHSKMLGWL